MPKLRRYAVIWSQIAVQDLDDIISFIAQESPGNAAKLWVHIRSEAEKLAIFPLRCRIVPEVAAAGLGALYRELLVGPYRILLQIRNRDVWVVGVFDGRRDMEEILFHRLFLA